MSTITKTLSLPTLGKPANWGNTLNNNFKIIESRINEIYSSVNSVQHLIGAGVPYVRTDNNQYFVNVELVNKDDITKGWKLTYYPKDSATSISFEGENKDEAVIEGIGNIYYQNPSADQKGFDAIPMYLGAYVLNNKAEGSGNGLPSGSDGYIDWQQGDYIVRSSSFGSIYSENYQSVSFNKMPVPVDYYMPQLSDKPYKLTYTKTNAIQWAAGENNKNFTLPYIGLSSVNRIEYLYSADQKEWTFDVDFRIEDPKADETNFYIEPEIKFYISTSTTINDVTSYIQTPVFLNYTTSCSQKQEEDIYIYTIAAEVDVSGILEGEKLVCCVSIAHSDNLYNPT